jgi:hypothetical protein
MGAFQSSFTFNKSVLTNGSQLPGKDYITGLLFYGSAPAAFPASKVKNMFSVQDAINVGITPNHTDETAAKAIITLVDTGVAGQTISYSVQEPINPLNTSTNPNLITLCNYTKIAGDVLSATTYAANVAAAINANQANTGGYTATSSLGVVTLTARPGLGAYLNAGGFLTQSGTDTAYSTITQDFGTGSGGATVGVASKLDVWYYHISEYFRMNPNGNLWVGVFADSGYTFVEIQTLQMAAQGDIRQIGVYRPSRALVTYGVTDANSINTICQTLDNNKMPLSAVLAEDIHSVTDLTTLPNLALLNDEWVSVNISQDGAAQGWTLYVTGAVSITNIGAIMGTISVNSVSADIAQPIPQNNISNGTENNLVAFANNALFTSVLPNVQTVLDNYRYIYTGNYVGYVGTYFNDDHCAIISNSNYAYIDQNRVEAKIERLMYQAYLPLLKSQLQLNADGTLFAPLIQALQSVGNNTLNTNMVNAGELSAVSTIINPRQNITAQGGIVITLYEVNNPIARTITVNVNSVSAIPS